MSIFSSIVKLATSVLPFPEWTNDNSDTEWYTRLAPGLGELTGALSRQIKTEGVASIKFATGKEIVLYSEGKCCAIEDSVIQSLTDEDLALVSIGREQVGKWGDGAILKLLLEAFIKLAPIIIPLILDKEPTPAIDGVA